MDLLTFSEWWTGLEHAYPRSDLAGGTVRLRPRHQLHRVYQVGITGDLPVMITIQPDDLGEHVSISGVTLGTRRGVPFPGTAPCVGLQEAASGGRRKMPGVADNMIEGLTTFGEKTQNTALARDGAGVLKQVLDAYEGHVRANEECVLAFPAMVIRPDIRTEALVGG